MKIMLEKIMKSATLLAPYYFEAAGEKLTRETEMSKFSMLKKYNQLNSEKLKEATYLLLIELRTQIENKLREKWE